MLHNSATRPAALKTSIRNVERRIQSRHENIGVAVDSIAHKARASMTSPATLVCAALFGIVIHRTQRLNDLQLLTILKTANTGLRLLLTVTSNPRPPPNATPGPPDPD